MAWGILDDHVLSHVPGTVNLAEKRDHEADRRGLKHGTGRSAHIILAPQPSDDPNDPLNWPYFKKLAIIFIIMYGSCLCASSIGPLLSAGTAVVAIDLKISISDVTVMSGYELLVAGCSGPFASAFSRKYGRRPVLLFSSAMGLIGTIIGSASNTYHTLLAARTIQGFAIPAYESLIFNVVADIFFVHERGTFTSIMSFVLAAVSNLTSVITGPIVTNLGWHYLFHILNACLGFQLILLFLFVPETAYERHNEAAQHEIERDIPFELGEGDDLEKKTSPAIQVEDTVAKPNDASIPPKKTFLQQLAVFSGTHSDENLLQLVAAPVLCFLNVAAFWVIAVAGAVTSFYVAQSYVAAQIFFYPPYNLSSSGVGFLFTGPFLGGMLGSLAFMLISDPLIVWCSKRNGGIYEPEFRIIPGVIGLISGAGICGYAAVTNSGGSMYAASTLWGVGLFGIFFVVTPANAYAIDAYREMVRRWVPVSGLEADCSTDIRDLHREHDVQELSVLRIQLFCEQLGGQPRTRPGFLCFRGHLVRIGVVCIADVYLGKEVPELVASP